jgi:3-oxoacyl-[acyl-carrier-protein] synthase-1
MLALQQGWMPGGTTLQTRDPQLTANYLVEGHAAKLRTVASNSFGFGGSNACLVFGAAA